MAVILTNRVFFRLSYFRVRRIFIFYCVPFCAGAFYIFPISGRETIKNLNDNTESVWAFILISHMITLNNLKMIAETRSYIFI